MLNMYINVCHCSQVNVFNVVLTTKLVEIEQVKSNDGGRREGVVVVSISIFAIAKCV